MAVPDLVLAAAVLALAVWTLRARSSFAAMWGFMAFGLLLALVWVRLSAMDVALTVVVIGAGATGVMLLLAARRGCAGGDATSPSRGQEWVVGVLCAIISAALAWAMLSLPEPPPSLAYLSAQGVTSPASGVLMAFRGLDRLLGSVVMVLAVIAVWSMAPDAAWGGVLGPRFPPPAPGALSLLARLLIPVGIVLGIAIAWVGADAPGGAFQGGTILALMWILAWVAGLSPLPAMSSARLRWAVVAGPLAFIAVGLLGFPLTGDFLAYPPVLARPLILLVEAAMTLSVAAALALLVAGPPERRA